MSKFAWVTLTTNDTYSLGALVLAHSLRRAGTQHQLAVMVTPGVSESMREKLKDVYNVVQEVNVMDSQDAANLALLARPELGVTFTKLHCWRLVQFEKCVFLDSDTLVLQNCDELFEREELSAAPDVSWPDCFNSGVFVYKPSQETFDKIVEFALKNGSFDGGDQGLLNEYFADWATSDIKKRLPFLYNVTAYATYCYLPAFKQFRDKIKILHFAGKLKPWLIHFNSQSKTPTVPSEYAHASDVIQLWWNIFFDNVHQNLNDHMLALVTIIDNEDNNKNNFVSEKYILPALMGWKSNYDNMVYQQQQHYYEQEQQHIRNMQYNEQYKHYQEYYTDKKIEFHDPWEEYYNKEERKAEIQTNVNNNNNNNINHEQNDANKWNEMEMQSAQQQEKQQEQQQQEHYYQEQQQQQHQHHHHDQEEQHYHNENVAATKDEESNRESEHREPEHKENEAKQEDHLSREHNKESKEETQNRDDKINDNLAKTHSTSDVPTNKEQKTKEMKHNTKTKMSKKRDESNNNNKNKNTATTISNATHDDKNKINDAKHVKENEEAGLAGALSHLRLGEPRTPEQDEYEQLMRRQCWESGQVDYSGRDSFDNIWRKISLTLENKPNQTDGFFNNNNANYQRITTKTKSVANVETTKSQQISRKSYTTKQKVSRKLKLEFITSADIEDGKTEYDPKTGATIKYHVIEGGYEVITTTTEPNGTVKTSKRTFWDPKPVSEEDMKQQMANRKVVQSRMNKEIRIDEKTTMLTRAIEGGYEEVYTTVNEDGTKSIKTKTFYDPVPEGTPFPDQAGQPKQPGNKKTTDTTDNRKVVQKTNKNQQIQQQTTTNVQQQSTYQETRRTSQNIEITENNRTVRKNSLQTEQNIRQVTSSNVTDGKDTKTKKTKKPKGSVPPPPADFVQNDSTTVTTKRVPGGMEYTYTTQLESGKTITTSKTVYEEEEVELTEEEIKEYKKALKDAEKHKNVTTTKKLKSESGTKKVVPSENPGDVTTVETIKIEGGTEYHYTTVTADGIVKKAVKTVYDPVPSSNPDDTEEEEIVEEYEEEVIEPGEKNVKTIETIKSLPKKFEEEVTITHEKKEKKTKRSMVIGH
ncbi:uncharacterized protein ACRADG_011151 [Cochliomyia hominivorax]